MGSYRIVGGWKGFSYSRECWATVQRQQRKRSGHILFIFRELILITVLCLGRSTLRCVASLRMDHHLCFIFVVE